MRCKPRPNDIKNAVSPLDFYTSELPDVILKKYGWNDGGLCPFHADNSKGSFHVNTETGVYKCFSCGAHGGDIIAFTMALYQLQFVEALTQLSDNWGL